MKLIVLAALLVAVLAAASGAATGKPNGGKGQAAPSLKGANSMLRASSVGSQAPRLADEINSLSDDARAKALGSLDKMNIPATDLDSVHVDKAGNFLYSDDFSAQIPARRRRAAPTEAEMEEHGARLRRYLVDNPPTGTDENGIPLYHSRPNSPNKLYLDFDGHNNPSDTAWGAFQARAFSYDNDYNNFNEMEILDIIDIWKLVAEDYAPFNIDVTTERPAGFQKTNHIHALITESVGVGGTTMPYDTAGGVAYLSVYGSQDLQYYSPALIYKDNAGDNAEGINLVVAHEVGHNFGLSHDGDGGSEYASGWGSGASGWGPIMGAPYGQAVVQWSDGDYTGSTNEEDDFTIIGDQTGYAADEAGDDAASSAAFTVTENGGSSAFEAKGLITSREDKDWYHITLSTSGSLSVSADPFRELGSDVGNNLDIKLTIYDDAGSAIATDDPTGTSRASLTGVSVSAGTYYIEIDGVGDSSVSVARSDYGSMGHYTISGTAVGTVVTVDTTAPPLSTSVFTTLDTTQATTTTTTAAPCEDDDLEDNDSFATASSLIDAAGQTLAICADDFDVFQIDVCDGGVLQINVLFSHNAGDIDTGLYDVDGNLVDRSISGNDNEYLQASGGGVFYLSVYGYSSAENTYMLSYNIECAPETTTAPSSTTATMNCPNEDAYEPNDAASTATQVNSLTIATESFYICPDNVDVFRIPVCQQNQALSVYVSFTNSLGDLDIYLYDINRDLVTSSAGLGDVESVHVTSGYDFYYLLVQGYEGSENEYQVLVCGSGCGDPSQCLDVTTTQYTTPPTTTSIYTDTTPPTTDSPTTDSPTTDSPTTDSPTTTSSSPQSTTADPCEGINNVRKERWCNNQCNGNYIYYNDAEDAGFTGCHRRHCECTSGSTTTYSPGSTTSDPCEGVNNVRREKWCNNQCDGNYNYYFDAEDAGFTGCHQRHCECTSGSTTTYSPGSTTSDPCEGVNNLRKERWCNNQCNGNYNYYNDAADAGFTGCHQRHCECIGSTIAPGSTTVDPCEGINHVRKEKWCRNQCNGNYNYYFDAENAGFTGCHRRHCECL